MSEAPEKPCFICGFSKAKEQKLINQGVEKAANLIRDYKISIVDDETGETGVYSCRGGTGKKFNGDSSRR